MQVTYALDATTVEGSQSELDTHHDRIQRIKSDEEERGRRVTIVVKLEIHQATSRETEAHPRAKVFPQPVKVLGALLPVVVAERLRAYAQRREQPLSDLTRALWTEFLIAKERGEVQDHWAKFIETRLDLIKYVRENKGAVGYARTRRVHVRRKQQKR